MDNDNVPKYDIVLHKSFDIKLKEGHAMTSANVDEKNYLKTFYFNKNSKIYYIDIPTKRLEELEFTKNHDVRFLFSNCTNEFIICVLKSGKVFGLDVYDNVYYLKNLFSFENNSQTKIDSNIKIFASRHLTKAIVYTSNQVIIWYQSVKKIRKTGEKKINELLGYHIYIQLKDERKILLSSHEKFYKENFNCYFGNNYFLGSFARLFYIIVTPCQELGVYKMLFVNYLFIFEKENKFHSINKTSNENNEYKAKFYSRYLYTYILNQFERDNEISIITKPNLKGNIFAIIINFPEEGTAEIIFFLCEIYKFSSCRLGNLFSNKPKIRTIVDDIEWICQDLFLLVVFSGGFFCVLNTNFQLVCFIDISKNITRVDNSDYLFIPKLFTSKAVTQNEKIRIIPSKKKSDYFIFYTSNIVIGFQCNNKNFLARRLVTEINSFDDFLSDLNYFQVRACEESNRVALFDRLNNFIFASFNEIFSHENDSLFQTEGAGSLIKTFVKFAQIFQNLNFLHETHLPILTYFITISNDFFFYLLNAKEIWLGFLFIELSERYLLKQFRLKTLKSKKNILKSKKEVSQIVFNPFYVSNLSLKCYNKITNFTIHSKLRLILMFYALIEFRNSQALNINVLYFILAKICVDKLKKNNLLDDIHLILKVIIRNWKYLKNENFKVGAEEYVLNGLTMNSRTELLSQFIHQKVNRDDNINFDFFNDFYSIDEFQTFVSASETYCYGEEEVLINQYGYANNVGVIQKWLMFYMHNMYDELFQDFRDYLGSHLKQTVENIMKKNPENISPDEMNLSSLIFFNLNFFILVLIIQIEQILKFYTSEDNSKKLHDFISPIDIPFLIYEFYSNENKQITANPLFEIPSNLFKIIKSYQKKFTLCLNDFLDFSDFILSSGFNILLITNEEKNEISNEFFKNDTQSSIFSYLIFDIMLIHKTNEYFLFDDSNHFNIYFQSIQLLDVILRKEVYELVVLIVIGYIRFSIFKELRLKNYSKKPSTIVDHQRFEIFLKLIRKIFSIVTEKEEFVVRKNIIDYLVLVPNNFKLPFIEQTLHCEYKFLKKICDENELFDFESMLDHKNLNKNFKVSNFFDCLFRNDSTTTFIDIIFPKEGSKFKLNVCLFNIISVIFNVQKAYTFLFETNSTKIASIIQFSENDTSIIDKIIIGNINQYKETCKDSSYGNNLVLSIKILIMKIIHLINIIYIKYKILSINPSQDTFNYLKLLSYCLLFEKDKKKLYTHQSQILLYISTLKLKEMTNEQEIFKLVEILYFLNLGNIINSLQTKNENFVFLENYISEQNKNLYNSYLCYLQTNLSSIEKYNSKREETKSKKLRQIALCIGNSFYIKICNVIINQMSSFANSISTKGTPCQKLREKYISLCNSFENLTGINHNSYIEFNSNWDLQHNHQLYSLITNDNFTGNEYFNKEKFDLLLNNRQKQSPLTENKKKKSESLSRVLKTLVKKIKDKEETISIEEINNDALEPKKNYKLKFKRKDSDEDDDIAYFINLNQGKFIREKTKLKPIEKFVNKITRIFFYELINAIFQKYKKDISGKELEEIKIIRVRPKENNISFTTLKEKFVSTNDLSKFQKDDYFSLNTINYFDVINLKKYQPGKSENSAIFLDLVKSKKVKKINETVKVKLEEFKEKMKTYEKFVKDLGKEFSEKISK